jgi:hypothetical protein
LLYNQLILTIMYQAQRGSDAAQFANLDTQGIAETLIPTIFQQAGEEAARDERKRSILRRSKTVTLTNGLGTLSDDVLTMYLEDSTYLDSSDLTKRYSWVREWSDFIDPTLADPPYSNLGYYSIQNGVAIAQREPGALYDPSSGETGSRTLNIPCVPEIPASATSTVDVPDEIISDILVIGSELLRGALVKAAAEAARV